MGPSYDHQIGAPPPKVTHDRSTDPKATRQRPPEDTRRPSM